VTTKVIGFEGHWSQDVAVAWGAAATKNDADSFVANGLTGLKVPEADFQRFLFEGVATQTPKFGLEDEAARVVVVSVRTWPRWEQLFVQSNVQCLGKARRNNVVYRAYQYPDQFESYIAATIDAVVAEVLYRTDFDETCQEVLRTLCTLKPQHPVVHAVRCFAAPAARRARLKTMAHAALATPEQRNRFDVLVQVLDGNHEYELRYAEGIAAGRGLNVGDLVRVMSALERVHEGFSSSFLKREGLEQLIRDEDAPGPQLDAFKAASASFKFRTRVDGEPAAMRLARFLELETLERAAHGNIDDELRSDPAFMENLGVLLHPSDDTVVSHRAGEDDFQSIAFEVPIESELVAGLAFECVGFVQGVFSNTRRLELRSTRRTYVVSTGEDGFGNSPVGAEVFSSQQKYLFAPMVASLTHFHTLNGRKERYYAQRISMLEPETPHYFEWAPSGLVPGAIVRIGRHALKLSQELLLIDENPVAEVLPANLHSVSACLEQLEGRFAQLELAARPSAQDWLIPVRGVKPSLISRLLAVATNERAPVNQWIASYYNRFGKKPQRRTLERTLGDSAFVQIIRTDDDAYAELTQVGIAARRVVLSFFEAEEELRERLSVHTQDDRP
jgi:hypothetical protein